jgi:hypothetical protein
MNTTEIILHLCENCEKFTDYLCEDYTNLWYCEDCATARAERQHECNFTNYWEGH